ncbi:hypothetical protein MASR2M64_08250 [Candidatus Cloacimonadota bacterium]|jgi:hypothetical protein|nr:hypothetical protein [Candidatus Cloacimonadota bacterium]MDD3234705.1 hypothetical protein [Candidatus Cloacimonadota bacterium]
MKKLLMLSLLMQLLIAPIAIFAESQDISKPQNLPTYSGDLNDPEIKAVNSGPGYVVVYYKGKYYIVYK